MTLKEFKKVKAYKLINGKLKCMELNVSNNKVVLIDVKFLKIIEIRKTWTVDYNGLISILLKDKRTGMYVSSLLGSIDEIQYLYDEILERQKKQVNSDINFGIDFGVSDPTMYVWYKNKLILTIKKEKDEKIK